MTDAEAASLAMQAARHVFSGLYQRRKDGSTALYVSRTGCVIRSSDRDLAWTSPEAYHAVMLTPLTEQSTASVDALAQSLLNGRVSAGEPAERQKPCQAS